MTPIINACEIKPINQFKEIRECLDRWENTIYKDNLNDDEDDFIWNSSIYFAKALYDELPSIKCVTQILQALIEEGMGNH